jgi:hypothetical protein
MPSIFGLRQSSRYRLQFATRRNRAPDAVARQRLNKRRRSDAPDGPKPNIDPVQNAAAAII